MSSDAWMPQVEALEKHHRVLRLDNRGGWPKWSVSEPYSLKAMASDCRAIVEQAGVQDVHVVGVSMGGMIAQEFALCYPSVFEALRLLPPIRVGPSTCPSQAIGLFLKANMTQGKDRIEALGKLLYPEEAREEFYEYDGGLPGCEGTLQPPLRELHYDFN